LSFNNILVIKYKKGISIVLMIFGVALIIQGWVPRRKRKVERCFGED
jgi:uncharacterized membrane protein